MDRLRQLIIQAHLFYSPSSKTYSIHGNIHIYIHTDMCIVFYLYMYIVAFIHT